MIETGFAAFGLVVPENRLTKSYEAIKDMLPDASMQLRYSIVFKCAHWIKRDEPFKILAPDLTVDSDLSKLDLTGRYRLLATLLTD